MLRPVILPSDLGGGAGVGDAGGAGGGVVVAVPVPGETGRCERPRYRSS